MEKPWKLRKPGWVLQTLVSQMCSEQATLPLYHLVVLLWPRAALLKSHKTCTAELIIDCVTPESRAFCSSTFSSQFSIFHHPARYTEMRGVIPHWGIFMN